MAPSFPTFDRIYVPTTNMKPIGYFFRFNSDSVKPPYFFNYRRSQPRMRITLSSSLSPPSLRRHVVQIFSLRSQPQVRWIHTRRIVAAMANKQAIGDRAVMKLIRPPMGINLLSFNRKASIALPHSTRGPQPTGIGAILFKYLFPKGGLVIENKGLFVSTFIFSSWARIITLLLAPTAAGTELNNTQSVSFNPKLNTAYRTDELNLKIGATHNNHLQRSFSPEGENAATGLECPGFGVAIPLAA